ncbi:hypothetical protein A5787_19360 [Mycobacterium sp. 852002-50816_SCH5313054-b]|uniref:PE-PPE domain-containing protein n=1 Tax=Mycobacterium sp. 852002-50816_SCH5313054-b TaxID=1834092 RepID=UPI00080083E2|nr:PE-PPE domain-containing protein [Mycobacterium sp. 852002-50816_SCH5313054-b]OBF60183.1 hypothetical protein A5787_19360 [Mycobacterium sp. 852002-50816_SCH5313054-b]
MSFVLATPEVLSSAAEDLARIGSAVNAANAAAANSTTSLLAAAADEVSTGIASLFGAHALEFQAATAQAAQFQERFLLTLAANANTYLTTEMATAQTLLARPPIPGAAAGTRITVPGAGPLYYANFITELPYLGQFVYAGSIPGPLSVSVLQGYDLLNHAIGQNWFPGTTPQVVNYPASIGLVSGSLAAPGVNQAVAMGQRALNDQIMNAFANGNGSPVRIAALSEGTLVVNRELAALAADPTAPPRNALQFAMFNGPETGLFHTYLPNGLTVPFVDYTAQGLPNTQYDVSVVFGQYDFFGNPPDRPWDLPAWVNSLFAGIYNHNTTSLVSMSDAVQVSSVTTSLGGTITTDMVPAPTLPMLFPLQQLGVPQPIVNDLNSFLHPIVDDGYSSLTPNAGPYFLQGTLQGLPPLPNLFW